MKSFVLKAVPWLDKAAFFILCLILFDCMALGGGAYLKFFNIDIRMWFFLLFFIISIPLVLLNIRKLIRNVYVIVLLLWFIWIVLSTVRGFSAGNRLDLIISGLIGFASFALLPGSIVVINSKERMLKLMKVSVVASVVLSIQTFFYLVIYNFYRECFDAVNLWVIAREIGGFSDVDHSVVRIFLRSQPMLGLSCASAFYFAINSTDKCRYVYCGVVALNFLTILFSYTRAIYLAVFVSAAFLIVVFVYKIQIKTILKVTGMLVSIFLVLLLTCKIVFRGEFINYAVYRSIGRDVRLEFTEKFGRDPADLLDGTNDNTFTDEVGEDLFDDDNAVGNKESFDIINENLFDDDNVVGDKKSIDIINENLEMIQLASDEIRSETVNELMKRIKDYPLLGSGMGAVLEVRENLDSYNEYFYLDQAFKTGIIGISLFVMPMVIMMVELLRCERKKDNNLYLVKSVFLSALLAIAVFCIFNPYLNGSNGITLYCCTIGVFSVREVQNS